MSNPIGNLNKVFESRIRLGIMSSLMVNADLSFNDLKQTLELSDGNLATHLVNLEENGYIKVHKGFIGKKTNTTYSTNFLNLISVIFACSAAATRNSSFGMLPILDFNIAKISSDDLPVAQMMKM